MTNIEMIRAYGHEQVAYFNNEKAGLKAIIALHNTNLGPAVGGCRLWPYENEEAALFDVLRLSRGMSHKNAAAGMPLGGAKGVILAHPSQKTEAMFEAFGEAVNTFMGKYYTAEDVNTDTKDADYMLRTTEYVVGRADVSGDPSPFTAIGVFDGIRAVAQFMNGSDSLDGMVYTFSGNGCSIIFGDLKFNTDRSFMGDTALPQIICDVMNSMQGENALTYSERNEPQSSTLTTAEFTGNTRKYRYTVTTDFDSGYIKEIEVADCDLTLTFSNK